MMNEQAASTSTPRPELLTARIEGTPLSGATRTILLNHLQSFQDNDLEGVMADYTGESVLVTQEQTYVGLTGIRSFFTELIAHFPARKFRFDLDKMVIRDELAFIVWKAKTPTLAVPLGTDTFIIKDGKISRQTFAGQLEFIQG